MTQATQASVATAQSATSDFHVSSVIGRSASLLLRHFREYFFVMLAAYLPMPLLAGTTTALSQAFRQLLAAWVVGHVPPTALVNEFFSLLAWAVVGFALLFVCSMVGQVVILHAAFQDARRQPVSLALSYEFGLRRLLPVLGLGIVMACLIFLGLILLIIPGLILSTIWFVAVAACVLERLGPLSSLRRSQELTKGYRWKVFGLALLFTIVGMGGALIEPALVETAGPIAGQIGNLIWTALLAAYSSVLVVVTYRDLRVAKEGTDVDKLEAVFA